MTEGDFSADVDESVDDGYTAPPNHHTEPFGALYVGALVSALGVLLLFVGDAGAAALAVLPAGVLLLCTGLILRGVHRAGERVAAVVADVAHHRL